MIIAIININPKAAATDPIFPKILAALGFAWRCQRAAVQQTKPIKLIGKWLALDDCPSKSRAIAAAVDWEMTAMKYLC